MTDSPFPKFDTTAFLASVQGGDLERALAVNASFSLAEGRRRGHAARLPRPAHRPAGSRHRPPAQPTERTAA